MALTRKFLSALGIESDKVDEIISAHTETTMAKEGQLFLGERAAVYAVVDHNEVVARPVEFIEFHFFHICQ